jgi:hypothetical protein
VEKMAVRKIARMNHPQLTKDQTKSLIIGLVSELYDEKEVFNNRHLALKLIKVAGEIMKELEHNNLLHPDMKEGGIDLFTPNLN